MTSTNLHGQNRLSNAPKYVNDQATDDRQPLNKSRAIWMKLSRPEISRGIDS
ncbi:hypothetical protein BofuT4_uP043990.1 [Botrytis cinerea T4]|uniref:Uncharacterized protein n=1 Tax=Botryotinia fuckeliana (strain T4) TaxID=999810 RepID=G2Y058_BOTF4|nr:hypothetical protein BofuT4_uP043990.1 [Botrytis cinerea T4]